MDEDLLARLKSSVELLAATIESQITQNSALIDSTRERIKAEEEVRRQQKTGETEAANRRRMDKARHDAEQENHKRTKEALNKTTDSLKKFYNEVLKISDAGIKFASTVGTTATKGVQLELKNRAAVAAQLFRLDLDRVVSAEQIKSAQQALAQSFISTREGMQLSATGARQFAQSLKGGFKSEFELTSQSLRALVTAGLSTERQFESFRKASGRAGLTSDQFATIVNKNSLSFMLYGQRFAKAAVEAERMGISLASVQAAQESMVTNLDGTIDTIAQINQLGGQIDFGSLTRINEFEGPEATLKYLQATIPPGLFQSASTRALLKGFGVPIEDLMKSANSAQASAADQIEQSMTESEKATSIFTKALGLLGSITSRVTMILNGSFVGLALAAGYAARQLFGVKGDIKSAITETFGKLSTTTRVLGGIGGIAGVGASMYGAAQAKKAGESVVPSIISGILSGATAGAMIGGGIPGAIIGAIIGGGAAGMAGMATGGPVRGPGSSTSDSILRRLSHGEYVINASSAKRLGSGFLNSLNTFGRVPGMADGGPVMYNEELAHMAHSGHVAQSNVEKYLLAPFQGMFSTTRTPFNLSKNSLRALLKPGSILSSLFNRYNKSAMAHLFGGEGVKHAASLATRGRIGSAASQMFGHHPVTPSFGASLHHVTSSNLSKVGTLGAALFTGMQEYGESGSVGRAIARGGMNALGVVLGEALGLYTTAGNPIAGAFGAYYGAKGADALFKGLFNSSMESRHASAGSMGNDRLATHVANLVDTINDATTFVDMNGTLQQVPRMRLAGVRSRYEVG